MCAKQNNNKLHAGDAKKGVRLRRYVLQIEAKVKAPESEVAIARMKKYIQKWSEEVRIVSITDEGGEKTYIEEGLVEAKY